MCAGAKKATITSRLRESEKNKETKDWERLSSPTPFTSWWALLWKGCGFHRNIQRASGEETCQRAWATDGKTAAWGGGRGAMAAAHCRCSAVAAGLAERTWPEGQLELLCLGCWAPTMDKKEKQNPEVKCLPAAVALQCHSRAFHWWSIVTTYQLAKEKSSTKQGDGFWVGR